MWCWQWKTKNLFSKNHRFFVFCFVTKIDDDRAGHVFFFKLKTYKNKIWKSVQSQWYRLKKNEKSENSRNHRFFVFANRKLSHTIIFHFVNYLRIFMAGSPQTIIFSSTPDTKRINKNTISARLFVVLWNYYCYCHCYCHCICPFLCKLFLTRTPQTCY